MKRKLPLLFGALFLAFAAGACEGPQGPEGPAGPQGETGATGPAGADGTNALNTCSDCHTSDATLVAIETQYGASMHGSGATFERNEEPCNQCHTSQGFTANLDGTTMAVVENPARVNCRTCHQVHTTYTGDDFALATTDAVSLIRGGTFDITALGAQTDASANLCANCHQAREVGDLTAATFDITSPYFGNHHGPQSQMLSGQGAFDLPGQTMPTGGGFGSHVDIGCVGCHMQDAYGAQAGGHTWSMTYDYHGSELINNDGTCDDCHSTSSGTWMVFGNPGTLRDSVQTALDSAAVLLQAQGIVDATNHAVVGTYDTDLVKAFLNWNMILEDRSLGTHNPTYAKGVLQATIDYLLTL